MVVDDASSPVEPEGGELRQDFALIGDSGPEHVIERRNAVGGDDEQSIAEVVDISDLPLPIGEAIVERGVQDGSGNEQQSPRAGKHRILQESRSADNNNM